MGGEMELRFGILAGYWLNTPLPFFFSRKDSPNMATKQKAASAEAEQPGKQSGKGEIQTVDPRVQEQASRRLEWAIGFTTVRYHFVYQILGMTVRTCDPYMGTMGVRVSGSGFELRYSPLFVESLVDEALAYVLYHEILHMALHHCTHRRFDNHELGNIATDLEVNELIPIVPGSCEPPKDEKGRLMGTFVSEFKKMPQFADIKEKQTAEWYYDYLRQKAKEQSGKGAKGAKGAKGGEGFDEHGGWSESEIADEKIRAKIREIEAQGLWGNVGSTEKELILAAQTQRINWRNILRQFYGNQAWHEKETTRKRPNRRTGFIHPGSRKIQLDRHLVAVDTSGSIDSDLLAQCLDTVNQMSDFVPIDLMQFDCEKTEDPRPFDRRRKEFTFLGRGGTSFEPVMKVVEERHYRSVVILTDGEAPAPTKPTTAQVVWVLPAGHNPPVDWGMRIHMSKYV